MFWHSGTDPSGWNCIRLLKCRLIGLSTGNQMPTLTIYKKSQLTFIRLWLIMNNLYKTFFMKALSVQWKLRGTWNYFTCTDYILSLLEICMKKFSCIYIQRRDERSKKERQYCYGFLRRFCTSEGAEWVTGLDVMWIVYLALPLTQNGIRQKLLSRKPIALFEKQS